MKQSDKTRYNIIYGRIHYIINAPNLSDLLRIIRKIKTREVRKAKDIKHDHNSHNNNDIQLTFILIPL